MLTCFGDDRQGAQGAYDGASKGILESEFGTSVDDEVIKQILEKGTLQESQVCLFLSVGCLFPLERAYSQWSLGLLVTEHRPNDPEIGPPLATSSKCFALD